MKNFNPEPILIGGFLITIGVLSNADGAFIAITGGVIILIVGLGQLYYYLKGEPEL